MITIVVTCFVWVLFLNNQNVININKFSVTMTRKSIVQLTNENPSLSTSDFWCDIVLQESAM